MGSCGIAAGADEVYEALKSKGYSPTIVGCNGMCYLEPIITLNNEVYTGVTADGIDEIIAGNGSAYIPENTIEKRIALRNCGMLNPENIDEYIANGGYKALSLSSEEIIEVIKTSGLAGRGGAGFPTWFKWNAARESVSESGNKYIICNADEGDPGAFMDRAIIEGDPHSLIEGMIIGAKAIGATDGIVYVRAEYPLAIERLQIALKQARERGLLGKQSLTGSNFDIRIKAGAGAFVCGEETALIASLEGERGMPRLKPPFPAQKGYWQQPSNINNVETFSNVPWIIANGGEAFAELGNPEVKSKGTKVFALTGKIAKGGLVEIPMGRTVRDVVYSAGGGLLDGKELKAVQLGGPSGGCIPNSLIDTEIDYAALSETGAIMGSGGMVVMDDTTCMVDMARYFLDFTCKESCGKCTHCRVGNKRMLEILERICEGQGREGDIKLLEELGENIKVGSLCALGQTAPNPVLTTLKYFRNEYEDHLGQNQSGERRCTAVQCRELLTFSIVEDKCSGCTLCKRKCPSDAISGELKQHHIIDKEKCTKCGLCAEACKLGAVVFK